MKNMLLKTIFAAGLFLTAFSFTQAQDLDAALLQQLLSQEELKEYFASAPMYTILANEHCDPKAIGNLKELRLEKSVMIGTKEDFFMRRLDQYIEITSIDQQEETLSIGVRTSAGEPLSFTFGKAPVRE